MDDFVDDERCIYCEEHWVDPPAGIRQGDFADIGCVKCGWKLGNNCQCKSGVDSDGGYWQLRDEGRTWQYVQGSRVLVSFSVELTTKPMAIMTATATT